MHLTGRQFSLGFCERRDKTYSRKVVSVVEPIPGAMDGRSFEGPSTRRGFESGTKGSPEIERNGFQFYTNATVW